MQAHATIGKRLGFAFICVTLALAALSPLAGAPRVAHAAGPYVVDTTAVDAPDSNVLDGTCSDGAGHCTLRAAIQQATFDAAPTLITFSFALTGTTLLLGNALTTGTILWVGDNITVTGESKNITISGAGLGAGKSVFKIEGNSNLLENLTVRQAPQDGIEIGDFAGVGTGNNNTVTNVNVFGNAGAGVYIFGGSSGGGQNNTISGSLVGAANLSGCGAGNNIGVFVDQGAIGTTVTTNTIICNSLDGVKISSANNVIVSSNLIGIDGASDLRPNGGNGVYAVGTTGQTVQLNVISGNALNGVLFENSSSGSIFGNEIGVDETVAQAIPNGGDGVALTLNSDHNAIGDSLLGDRNIIGGNAGSGISMAGSGAHDNVVAGNYIGTNLAGSTAIANGVNGVHLQGGAHDNLIGGVTAEVRNLISGNGQAGILIDGSGNNTISFNLIGLNASGNSALPNGQDGIWLNNGSNGNTIGGGTLNQAQFIGGNTGSGVLIVSSDGNSVLGSNRIGVSPSGSAIGNGDGGVFIIDSSNNVIYPTQVANNTGAGVAAIGNSSVGNDLGPLHVSANTGLPIDLGNDGPTLNDGIPDIGPNNFVDYPVITASAGQVISGTTCDDCTIYIYRATGNPAAPFGGGDYLDSTLASATGHWSYTLPGGLTRIGVTLQARDLSFNTSEFSPRPSLFLPLMRR